MVMHNSPLACRFPCLALFFVQSIYIFLYFFFKARHPANLFIGKSVSGESVVAIFMVVLFQHCLLTRTQGVF